MNDQSSNDQPSNDQSSNDQYSNDQSYVPIDGLTSLDDVKCKNDSDCSLRNYDMIPNSALANNAICNSEYRT